LYITEYIPEGTLLIVEKGIIGNTPHIANCLKVNCDIAKELYPRKLSDYSSYDDLYEEKVKHNCFQWYEDTDPTAF
jgi:hypothetical protein